MTDITSKTFGYLIAYVLPGSAALYATSLWSPWIKGFIDRVLGSDTRAALFLAAFLIALGAGMIVSLIRSAVFESRFRASLLGRPVEEHGSIDFGTMWREGRHLAVESVVNEAYRYHQFWGGIAVVLPIYMASWLIQHSASRRWYILVLAVFVALVMEILLVQAARGSLHRYESWLRQVLRHSETGEAPSQ